MDSSDDNSNRCEGACPDGPRDEESQLETDADGPELNGSNPTSLPPPPLAIAGKHNRGWRKLVRNFTPSWFSVNMGNGIVSILLYNLPYQFTGLSYIATVIFCFNILLFGIFFIISVLRYSFYPEIWSVMLRHPVQSLFLGTFPIAFATIIIMTVLVCTPSWGEWVLWFAWAFWWIDSILSVTICMALPFIIMRIHHPQLDRMTAAWLLPVVAPIVAAATGGIVAEALIEKGHHEPALWTLVASYILWGIGIPLSMIILAMYFQRLAVHSLPPREAIVSVFLPVGPLGQGAFGIMQLGVVASKVLPATGKLSPNAGEILYDVGWLVAIIMWGFGLVWLCFALASIMATSRFPFNMGWWGFVFPLGVFTSACQLFGKELDSRFFNVLGTILSVAVLLLWILCAVTTIVKSWAGTLIYAPCLADIKPKEGEKTEDKNTKHWWHQLFRRAEVNGPVRRQNDAVLKNSLDGCLSPSTPRN